MDTPVRYLACDAIDNGPALRMTEEQRMEQLAVLVYGNVHVEHPAITMELARKIVQKRRAAGTLNAFIVR